MVEIIIIKSNLFVIYFCVISIYIKIIFSVIMIDSIVLIKVFNINKYIIVKLDWLYKDDMVFVVLIF